MKNLKRQTALLISVFLLTSFFPLTGFSAKTGAETESVVMAETVYAAEKETDSGTDSSGGRGSFSDVDAAVEGEAEGLPEEAAVAGEDGAAGTSGETDTAAGEETAGSSAVTAAAAGEETAGSSAVTAAAAEEETTGSSAVTAAAAEEESTGSSEETDADAGAGIAGTAEKADPAGNDDSAAVNDKAGSEQVPSGAEAGPGGEETVAEPAVNAGEYTVTLKANGGGYFLDTANGGAHRDSWIHTGSSGEVIYNWSYEKPKGNPGKIFEGWSMSAGGSILSDNGYTLQGSVTLYAIWKQGCAVTLNANGGFFTQDGENVSSVVTTVEKGTNINSFSFGRIDSPTASGKRFYGYSLTAGGERISDSGYTVNSNTLTLYTVWINTCTVIYHAGGGGYFTDDPDGTGQNETYTDILDEGSTIYRHYNLLLVPYEGNTFLHWSLKEDGSMPIPDSGYTVGTGTLHIYAVWAEVKPETCIVTFDGNGGKFARAGRVYPTTKEAEVKKGAEISLYDTSLYGGSDPTRSGAAFKGWAAAADSTGLIPADQAAAYKVDHDVTVYAVWETKIIFDGNGGTFAGGGTTAEEKVLLGRSTVVDLGVYTTPEKTDASFIGWAENPEATAPMSEAEVQAYVIGGTNSNCESYLYAVWTENAENNEKIEDAVITLARTSMPYTGQAQTPAVTVTYGGENQILTAGTDYTVSYSNNVNAGTANAVITGKGRFSGSVTRTFAITRIAQRLTLSAASSVQAGKTMTLTAGGAKETDAYTFSSSNTSVATVRASGAAATVTGVNKGTVTITVTTPQTTNYTRSTKTVSIQVTLPALKKPGNCRFVKWYNNYYSKCKIRWNTAEWAEGYQTLLCWTDGSHATWKTVNSSVQEQVCEVAVNHVSQFTVRAYYTVNGKKVYGPWSNVAYITPSPTKFTVKKEGTTSGSRRAGISWNIIYGCNGYNVFVTTNPKGTWYWNQSTDTSAVSTRAVISKYRGSRLKKGQRYYVRIVTRRKRNGVFCTVPMPAYDTYIGTFKF